MFDIICAMGSLVLYSNVFNALFECLERFRRGYSISLASFLLGIGKQNSPRWDAAKRVWGYSVGLREFHRKNEIKMKNTPDAFKNYNGLILIIRIGKSNCPVWVK